MSQAAAAERPPPDERKPSPAAEVSRALVAQARETAAPPPQRFEGIDRKRLFNPSAMLRRRNLLTRIFSHLAFRKVAFDERHVRSIRDQARDGDVVYVMNHRSVLDYLYFNYAFLRLGLPLAYFANRISMTPFKTLWRMLVYGVRRLFGYYKHRLVATERLAFGLEKKEAALIFLKHRAIWPWAPEASDNSSLVTVIESQLERTRASAAKGTTPRPIKIVPQLLVWTHNPDKYRKTFWDTVFGNPEAPGRLRKFINFVANRRRAFVQVGKPIDLVEFLAEHRSLEDTAEIARKLRYTIHQALSLEERVIKGPILKRAKQIREEIMRNPRVEREITRLSTLTGQSERSLRKEISGYVKEMSADFSMTYIEIMCMVMTVVFSRLYSEMVADLPGLEKVRDAARKAPLVLLPCHRSHIDYLVISYLFYVNGLIPPHIAAGKNLNFFPIGKIFRRSGAFFLRRSFKGNRPYTVAFREYLRKLIKDGYWVEFFIEGGRSRTGKMLPPRFGMLKIIIDAIRSGAAKDVYLVPIYVGYEQIIEERSFSRELSGEEKRKENITQLLKTTQVLWSKYERLYVNFADPISCREALERAGLSSDDADAVEAEHKAYDDDDSERFLHRMGYRVVDGINSVAMVTPSALTSLALLANDKRGVAYDELIARVGFLLEIANEKKARLSKTLEHALKIRRPEIALAQEALGALVDGDNVLSMGAESPVALARGEAVKEVIDEVLGRFVKVKHLERHDFDDGAVFVVKPDRRVNLDFYKNNIIHLLVPEAIVATAILSTADRAETTLARVTEAAAFLTRTFKYEFAFDPDKGFGTVFGDTLTRFEKGGLIRRIAGEDFTQLRIVVTRQGEASMRFFHRLLLPWIEAYWLLATALDKHGSQPLAQSALIKKAQAIARRRFQVGDVTCPEASSSVNFKHALNAYEEFGMLSRTKKGRDKLITCFDDGGHEQAHRILELAERLRQSL